MRILVEVAGGCVQAVYCDDIDASLFIVDYNGVFKEYIDDETPLDLDELTVDGGSDDIDHILYHRGEEDAD